MSEFFHRCVIESSNFNLTTANQDEDWKILESLYDKAIKRQSTSNKIPNIFHYIWLGGELPELYSENIKDWKNKNPEFEIKIWNDLAVESAIKEIGCFQDLYKSATNVGMKSDIARYVILYQYGGIYMDTDFLCLSSDFKELNKKHSFYTGLSYDQEVCFFNGFFACSKNHPIMLTCLSNINLNTYSHISCEQTRTLHQTGPMMFTRVALSYLRANMDEHFLPMPTQLLYPFPAVYRNNPEQNLVNSFIKPWSIACHMWHSSWSPNSNFYKGN